MIKPISTLLTLLAFLSLAACTNFSNKIDQRALQCGTEYNDAPGQVKVYDFLGRSLGKSELLGLVLEKGQVQTSIEFTDNGCFTPPATGNIYIRTLDFKMQIHIDAETSAKSRNVYLSQNYATVLEAAGPLEDRRRYFGQEFYFIKPGYALNFYSIDNLKNLDIQYCLKKIDPALDSLPGQPCADSEYKLYFDDQPAVFNDGFWVVWYKTNVDPMPKNYLFAVETYCGGIIRNLDYFNTHICTSVGNIDLIQFKGENLQPLKYVASIDGFFRVTFSKIKNLQGLENLTKIGEFSFASNRELEDITAFKPQKVIGDFALTSSPKITSLDTYAETSFQGHSVILKDMAIENLDFMRNRVPHFSLTLDELPRLTTLKGLSGIKIFEGELRLSSLPALTSLEGLESLEEIQGTLSITNLPLTSLEGLENLKTVGESMAFYTLKNLVDLSALSRLESIGEELVLSKLLNLKSLKGLEGLVRTKNLTIFECNSLASLDGLSGLQEVAKNFTIYLIPARDLIGLVKLKKVGGLFQLMKLPLLEKVDGMSGLLESGSLIIDELPQIKSIAGLSQLKVAGYMELSANICSAAVLATLQTPDSSIANWCSKPAP